MHPPVLWLLWRLNDDHLQQDIQALDYCYVGFVVVCLPIQKISTADSTSSEFCANEKNCPPSPTPFTALTRSSNNIDFFYCRVLDTAKI